MSALGGVVLDSTALLGFASGRPDVAAVVWHAVEQGVMLVVPAASLADAQARLAPADPEVIEVLGDLPVTMVVDLTRTEARAVAAVLSTAGTPECLAAGHAAWTAHHRGMRVLTSEPVPLRALDADIEIDEIPSHRVGTIPEHQQHPGTAAAHQGASLGHYVFPVWPRSKKPTVTDWETRATRDGEAIRSWWDSVPYNIGIATGRGGLVVIDLDDAHGHPAPPRWPGARHGRDVLAQLAEQAGQPLPTSTSTVRTPTGGLHLYYRAPQQVELRNTAARLGWRIDTRAHGGCIIAAGSVRAEGLYRVINDLVAPASHNASAPSRVVERLILE